MHYDRDYLDLCLYLINNNILVISVKAGDETLAGHAKWMATADRCGMFYLESLSVL